ncbi:MAG: glycosyltransferase, partial [Candidatus Omnitrophota bacterium]
MSTSLAGKTLFLACGGTGGHIFPAFAVAEELAGRHPDLNIRYICGDKDIESKIFATIPKNRFDVIRSAPFRGVRSFADPSFLLKLIQGIRSARELLASGKPDLVVGFGGYLSFPLVWMAGGMKIKTLIHEQNVVPGTANRLLSGRVDAAALSSEATRKALTRCRRTVVTGNPIRPMIERDCAREALDLFGFDPDRLTILVLGGSQGAESINTIFLGALRFIGKQYRRKIQVL